MIIRTEFSFRKVFGPLAEVVALLPSKGGVIADDGCWGHVPFAKECAKQGKRPILGRRIPWGDRWAVIVPTCTDGLRALYAHPGGQLDLDYARGQRWHVFYPGAARGDLPPNFVPSYVPGIVRPLGTASGANSAYSVAFSDNLYPSPGDREAYQLMLGRKADPRPGAAHILTPDELILEGATPEQIAKLDELLADCDTPLPKAENILYPLQHYHKATSHEELVSRAVKELARRGLDISPYKERLARELDVIREKQFADYFLVISDMINHAKKTMLVGPARGSSCGSLACWLLRITEVDPIKHDLLFERFIDINRADLPDIDIDFPDAKRHLVIEWLGKEYGWENVAHIGTIMRYKPKSALTDIAKHGNVPLWELDKLKDVIIERSSGDMRYRNQLSDSFEQLEVGKNLLAKFPVLAFASRLEDHARSAGTHAAGIIVCNRPVTEYCATELPSNESIEKAKHRLAPTKGMRVAGTDVVTPEQEPFISADKKPDYRIGAVYGAQIDKKMAESLNMLKIDALGLRTLSVIEECCSLVDMTQDQLYSLDLNDAETFDLLNEHKYGCVFQFEGMALQTVAQQITITCFQDIAALTALCRPGPLSGGETQRWVKGKNSNTVNPLHPSLEPYTRNEYGCIIYQEQVMRVCLEIGDFSWADVGKIRNLMSKTVGDEAFAKFGNSFKEGAKRKGVSEEDAGRIWKAINSMGSWAFNLSHAVAYGIVSYWTAYLKAHHPIEFAVANLRNSRDEDSTKATLREIMKDGLVEFIPVDKHRSTDRWEFADNALLGPLTGIKGCGPKTAREILARRASGVKLTPGHTKLLLGESKYADYAPTRKRWGHIYDEPTKHFRTVTKVDEVKTLQEFHGSGRFCVIGRLMKKNLRNKNDEKWLARRNGVKVPANRENYLLFNIEDDTGQMLCCIGADKYESLGKRIVEEAKLEAWFAVVGNTAEDFKILLVENVKWLTGS